MSRPTTSSHVIDGITHHSANVRALLAADADTPPDALDAYSRDDDASVRRAAAKNPQTSSDTLTRLAHNNDCVSEVASNPALPEELQLYLAEHQMEDDALVGNPSLTTNAANILAVQLADAPWLLCQLLDSPAVTAETLEKIAACGNKHVRAGVAAHPLVSASLSAELAKYDHSSIKVAISGNPHTPPDVLKRVLHDVMGIYEDDDDDVCPPYPPEALEVAVNNPEMPEDLLAQIFISTSEDFVAMKALSHPNMSTDRFPSLLQALEKRDLTATGHQSLAKHPRTPGPVLEEMARNNICAWNILERADITTALIDLTASNMTSTGLLSDELLAAARQRVADRTAAPQ